MDLSELRKIAPSVFAAEPHESRSDRYAFIPTINVLEDLRDKGFHVASAREATSRDETRHGYTKHMLRLRREADLNVRAKIDIPEIVITNSHDGGCSWNLLAGIFRLICTNGMVAGVTHANFRVKHTGNVTDDVFDGCIKVVESAEGLLKHIDEWREVSLTDTQRTKLATEALKVRYGEQPAYPVAPHQILRPRRHFDTGTDFWTTFNVVQENLIRGGLSGRASSGRRIRTRSINGIDSDIKINQGLMDMAEKLVKEFA